MISVHRCCATIFFLLECVQSFQVSRFGGTSLDFLYNNDNLPISRFGMKISRFIKKATHLYETTLEEQQCGSCMVMKSGFPSLFLCEHLYLILYQCA